MKRMTSIKRIIEKKEEEEIQSTYHHEPGDKVKFLDDMEEIHG